MKTLLYFLLMLLVAGMAGGADRSKPGSPGSLPPAIEELKPSGKAPVNGVKARRTVEFRPRLRYTPPRLKAPKVSTGPGARGSGEEALTLALMAPEHAGWTLSDQPTLYWYQSGEVDRALEFTLVVPGEEVPVMELTPVQGPAGCLQAVDLRSHGVRLRPGVSYRWSVAMVLDADRRSNDVVASGMIERVEAEEGVRDELMGVKGWDRAVILGREGIWYDAVEEVMGLEGEAKWEGLAALAREVGLKGVAGYCDEERERR